MSGAMLRLHICRNMDKLCEEQRRGFIYAGLWISIVGIKDAASYMQDFGLVMFGSMSQLHICRNFD